ncbi:alpha/beta fold hydrolase [Microvirga antarctica]|uniref:alpha/beta fold hydrolase n=1 Tax=Microvirga antarctica TaxID=2819233 RepID=UPI001B30336F|nr:alpha/beta fold hydrolase [Microvirga antarctica]
MLLVRDNGHLHYDLLGPASGPVVCMTHSLTSDSGMWAEQVPILLAAGYQVLRLDMRGHGGSSPYPGPYTIELLAADVVAILDSLGFTSVHLIGLSMGGMIGQVLAADYPDRLLSLMACATTSRWDGDEAFMRGRIETVRAQKSLGSIVDDNMWRRYSPAYQETHGPRWMALRETFLGTSLDGYFGCMEAILAHNVSGRLPGVTAPTLVVAGSDDVSTPPASNQEIARLIPGARYVEIPGGRHFPNVEFDDAFNQIMMDWLSRADALH